MRCPQCDHDQVFPGAECERCGVIFARLRPTNPERPSTPRPDASAEEDLDAAATPPLGSSGRRAAAISSSGHRAAAISSSGRRAAAIGLGLALLTQFLPFLQMLIQYMVVLVHELGHAAAGWLFGYPSIPAFDFMYGGGVTSHTGRSSIVVLGVLGLAGYLLWQIRPHRTLFRMGLCILVAYVLLLAIGGDGPLIVAMGHGAELLFAGLFFYRALTGSGCHLEAERPLYAWLGWHIVFFDLRFAWGLATSGVERASYAAAKGGGHWMDFSRLANETFSTPLETVAVFFALFCLIPLPAAWWLAVRKKSIASALPAS